MKEWVSSDKPYEIEGLKTGIEYTLRETIAPEGYTITSDTTFTIDENGKVTGTATISKDDEGNEVLVVEDDKTHVTISKVEVAGGPELPGADIKILRMAGENEPEDTNFYGENNEYVIVEEWTSTEEAHKIDGLKTGVEYILRETIAPDG